MTLARGEELDQRAVEEVLEEWVGDGDPEKAARGLMGALPVEIGEAICRLPQNFDDFSGALLALKRGLKVAREGWGGRYLYLCPAGHADTTEHPGRELSSIPLMRPSYIEMFSWHDGLAPWTPSQADMLADDWVVRP